MTRPFGDDDLARAETLERIDRRFNHRRISIDQPLGIKLDEVGFEHHPLAGKIQAKQPDAPNQCLAQPIAVSFRRQNRDAGSFGFDISSLFPPIRLFTAAKEGIHASRGGRF